MWESWSRTGDHGFTANAFPGAVERRHLDSEASLFGDVIDDDRFDSRVDLDLLTQTSRVVVDVNLQQYQPHQHHYLSVYVFYPWHCKLAAFTHVCPNTAGSATHQSL